MRIIGQAELGQLLVRRRRPDRVAPARTIIVDATLSPRRWRTSCTILYGGSLRSRERRLAATPSTRGRIASTPSRGHTTLKAASHAASAQERDHGRQVPLPPAARHEGQPAHVRRVLAYSLHQRTSGSGGMARPLRDTNVPDAARVRGSDGRVPCATYFFSHAGEGRAAGLGHVRPVHNKHVVRADVLSCFDAHSRLFQ